MIGYFILVHRYPEQFKRLFRSIYLPGNSYVVHVDKSSGRKLSDDISAFLSPYQGVQILPAENALWGGYSLVDAELRGMEALLKMNSEWAHYINLSGQDFPLKSQTYISRFLSEHPATQFIRADCQRTLRPETMNRVNAVFVETLNKMHDTGFSRKFIRDSKPFIGTQWKVVTRSFCEFACNDLRTVKFKRFYRHSFIADESFFQTIMMNYAGFGRVVNNDLRMIDWVPDGDIKLRPRNFGTADIAELIASPDLFARKFDSSEDELILGLLEAHLQTSAANDYLPTSPGPKVPPQPRILEAA